MVKRKMNEQTLIEYLLAEPGYTHSYASESRKQYLIRVDGSRAAEFDGSHWTVFATQEEMVGYRNATEKACPKMERSASMYKPAVPKFG